MYKIIITIVLLIFSILSLQSQNLISNPSFEDSNPIRYCDDIIFEHIIWDWSSIYKYGSPDIYSMNINHTCPTIQRREVPAFKSNTCIGFFTLKEQIKAPLLHPLEAGKIYYLSLWVKADSSSLSSNNLGFLFTKNDISIPNRKEIIKKPQVNHTGLIKNTGRWEKKEFIFIAKASHEYINIGNFYGSYNTQFDTITTTHKALYSHLSSYLYIDNLYLSPLSSIGDSCRLELGNEVKRQSSKLFTENLYFQTGSYHIEEENLQLLKKVSLYLLQNPFLTLKIVGYTDQVGSKQFNLSLSQKRANAIKAYLLSRNIASERISTEGKGEMSTDNTGYESKMRSVVFEFSVQEDIN